MSWFPSFNPIIKFDYLHFSVLVEVFIEIFKIIVILLSLPFFCNFLQLKANIYYTCFEISHVSFGNRNCLKDVINLQIAV